MKTFQCAVLLILFLLRIGVAEAQTSLSWASARIHTFPQVVDGQNSDGSYYRSTLIVTSILSTTCSLKTSSGLGFPISRFGGVTSFTVTGVSLYATSGTGPVVMGYAVLECNGGVTASMMYALIGHDGHTVSMATVFSAPSSSSAILPMITGTGLRYGIAVANTSLDPAAWINLTIAVNVGEASDRKQILLGAGSQYVHFVDEIVAVPQTPGLGLVEIVGSGPPCSPVPSPNACSVSTFFLTGLVFDGPVFTTLVPATH